MSATTTIVSPAVWLKHVAVATFVFVLPGSGALAALALAVQGRVPAVSLVLFGVGFLLTGFGVTIGYHRFLAHHSFETSRPVEAALLVLGAMAGEGRPIDWVANHLKHHAFTEQPGDPHSPSDGFVHSHWGWLFSFSGVDVERYAAVARRDPVARWVGRTFFLWLLLGYAIPFLIGGWEGLVWGGLFRQFAVQNVTFAVNSVCHRWGQRPFKTNDSSRNNLVVGLLALGEGWHNNHHAFPRAAFHGFRWWQVDLSGFLIRWLEATRLAWNVRRPNLISASRGPSTA